MLDADEIRDSWLKPYMVTGTGQVPRHFNLFTVLLVSLLHFEILLQSATGRESCSTNFASNAAVGGACRSRSIELLGSRAPVDESRPWQRGFRPCHAEEQY